MASQSSENSSAILTAGLQREAADKACMYLQGSVLLL